MHLQCALIAKKPRAGTRELEVKAISSTKVGRRKSMNIATSFVVLEGPYHEYHDRKETCTIRPIGADGQRVTLQFGSEWIMVLDNVNPINSETFGISGTF
jgi:hypothetical protein